TLVVSLAALFLALLPALLADWRTAQAAPAVVITVNNLSDIASPGPGVCTFRAALQAANTNQAIAGCPAGSPSGSDLIVVPAVTLTITQFAGLNITSTLAISGAVESQSIFKAINGVRWLY